jgi:IS5 family transposase
MQGQHQHKQQLFYYFDINIDDKVPDHSSLTRIRDRLGLDIFSQFFDKILGCCKNMWLIKGERVMTYGTLFNANASLDSLVLKEEKASKDKTEEITSNMPGVTPPVKRSVNNRTHISKTYPDATLAVKAGTPRTLKYKAHISIDADTRIILDAKVTTGATHESQVYLEQLQTIENRLNVSIKRAIADRAYGSGDIIQSLLDRQITPNIALFSGRSGSSQDPEGLIYDAEENRYKCPKGKYLNQCPTIQNNTAIYLSISSDCKVCNYSKLCPLKLKDNKKNIRIHTRHLHRDLFEKVKVWMTEEKFQSNLVERMWKMEGLISEAKNLHCLSRAKYRGLKKTQIQAYMVASALNLKRLTTVFYTLLLILKYISIYILKTPQYNFTS